MRKYLPFFICLLAAAPAFSQWSNNTTVNNVVVNSNREDYQSTSVSDGAGGSIIFCQADNDDLYAQKILTTGVVSWGTTASPVPVCVTTQFKEELNAIPDGNGGAFVAWRDGRLGNDFGEIYIQRINSAGVVQWGANGLRVTNIVTRDNSGPTMCGDGAGGVIISWYWDDMINKNIQVSAQRYNSAGVAQWTANGVQVCTAAGFRGLTAITSDGSNGAILFFLDTRDDTHGLDYDYLNDGNNELLDGNIYGQRLNGSGARQWSNNGVAVNKASGTQQTGQAIGDGAGGAICVFEDGRNDVDFTNIDLFAQRVNASGNILWANNGVAITTAAGNQFLAGTATDGSGGIVVSFQNENGLIYGQRITAAGGVSWTSNGLALLQAADAGYGVGVVADGNGNTIFAFVANNNNGTTVRAQKVNAAGALQWTTAGANICTNAGGFTDDVLITASDNGGAIISWNNSLGSTLQDVYASKVLTNGVLAGASAVGEYVSATSGNWTNPSTWLGGVVPPAGAAVVIHHAVSCNVNTSCSSLKVETAAGNLTVMAGFTITITK